MPLSLTLSKVYMILMLLLLVFFSHDCGPIDLKISKYILYIHIIYILYYIYILYVIYMLYVYIVHMVYIYVKHDNRNPFNKVGSLMAQVIVKWQLLYPQDVCSLIFSWQRSLSWYIFHDGRVKASSLGHWNLWPLVFL